MSSIMLIILALPLKSGLSICSAKLFSFLVTQKSFRAVFRHTISHVTFDLIIHGIGSH